MSDVPLVDLAPLAKLLALAALLALLPLSWVWLRSRRADARARLATLTALTLFLTFDLIVFGSFTRLTDSGLGCPDWPGCYGEASPFGAHEEIRAAQAALPSGPVTFTKAWIEMIHRYLAMTVGALILVMAVFAWAQWRRGRTTPRAEGGGGLPLSPWWPTATLVWVIVQGLFGKYTVTLKLYPAVVTLHLLGGLALLVLLAVQHEAFRQRPLTLAPALRRAAFAVAALLGLQIALGGWVSTNYAVLACTGFPQCNGSWWPEMDFAGGFTILRHLGQAGDGGYLAFEALVGVAAACRGRRRARPLRARYRRAVGVAGAVGPVQCRPRLADRRRTRALRGCRGAGAAAGAAAGAHGAAGAPRAGAAGAARRCLECAAR